MSDLKHLQLSDAEIQGFEPMLAAYLPKEILQHGALPSAIMRILLALDELAAPAICAIRAEKFGIKDQRLLAERIIFRENNRVVLAGLRFRQSNPKFPFVLLTANFLLSPGALADLREKISRDYESVGPMGISLRQAPSAFEGIEHEKWSHTLWGRISDLDQAALPENFRADWNGGVDFYAEYKADYAEILKRDPVKATYLRFETQADLEEASRQGLLMSLWDDKGWVGAVAGRAKELYGLPSIYIFELIVANRLRGQRLAKPMQALFLKELSSRFEFVFGYINHVNPSSLRTALSMGRKIIETEYFFKPS